MNYKLVPMDKSHLSQVAAIERECFSHPWSEALLEQELYNDMISLVVAEGEDGTVLGYGRGHPGEDRGGARLPPPGGGRGHPERLHPVRTG